MVDFFPIIQRSCHKGSLLLVKHFQNSTGNNKEKIITLLLGLYTLPNRSLFLLMEVIS